MVDKSCNCDLLYCDCGGSYEECYCDLICEGCKIINRELEEMKYDGYYEERNPYKILWMLSQEDKGDK